MVGGTNALPWLRVEGNRIKDPVGRTVVLRGLSLVDLGATELWYGGVRPMIDRLTDHDDGDGGIPGWYPSVLRLPVFPAGARELASPWTFRPGSDDFYDRLLRPTVDYCAGKGLYVIVDWHGIGDTSQNRQATEEFWRAMSSKLGGESHVLFELFNEPVNDGDWDRTRADMQTWYELVRQHAPHNLVLVGTPSWCSRPAATADRPVEGTNIAYVTHMYPWHWRQRDLRDQIASAAVRHAVFHTEWGFQAGASGDHGAVVNGTVSSYGAPLRAFLEARQISWTAWCASYDWLPAVFNRDWTLRTGEGGMGGFLKRWLYDQRACDRPAAGTVPEDCSRDRP